MTRCMHAAACAVRQTKGNRITGTQILLTRVLARSFVNPATTTLGQKCAFSRILLLGGGNEF